LERAARTSRTKISTPGSLGDATVGSRNITSHHLWQVTHVWRPTQTTRLAGLPSTTDLRNAFTMSHGIYPLLATGTLLYRARRVGPAFLALMSSGGAAFVGLLHFGMGDRLTVARP
jgi:hypothetical protein